MKPLVRRAAVLLVAAGIGWYLVPRMEDVPASAALPGAAGPARGLPAAAPGDPVRQAFEQRASGRMLQVEGVVVRNLADDRDGSPHQRFIIDTSSGLSLLVAHNIELAPRLDGLAVGDRIRVYGEYEWNDQGGLMHWTHDDPAGRHEAGYIEWRGRQYQ